MSILGSARTASAWHYGLVRHGIESTELQGCQNWGSHRNPEAPCVMPASGMPDRARKRNGTEGFTSPSLAAHRRCVTQRHPRLDSVVRLVSAQPVSEVRIRLEETLGRQWESPSSDCRMKKTFVPGVEPTESAGAN
eukprot:1956306-Rhodomonas_salina.2